MNRVAPVLFLAQSICFTPALAAQPQPSSGEKLQYVAVLSRHGVRTPLWTNQQLNAYSVAPWPAWEVPLGNLTKQGGELMKLVGAYDREYLIKTGLLSPNGCGDAGRFYFWSDTSQRDIATGHAILAGMLPGCTVPVNSVKAGAPDPLFNPLAAGVGKSDPNLAVAAVVGRIGGHPDKLTDTYHAALETLQRVLLQCDPGAACPTAGKVPTTILLDQPTTVKPVANRLAQLDGPVSYASSIAESLLLEYTDGKPAKDVGWGRVNPALLRDILFVQEAHVDLLLRTPYLARVSGSNLLSHMLNSMQQAVRGQAVKGALGKPGDRALFVIGHDSNVSNLGGMLGVSWLLDGYQPNSRPPGVALMFEIWGDAATGKRTVRTSVMSQTMDQMRNLTPLTLQAPPSRAPIFIPGCSVAKEGWPCDWDTFEKTVLAAIDPAFVSPDAPQPGPPVQ